MTLPLVGLGIATVGSFALARRNPLREVMLACALFFVTFVGAYLHAEDYNYHHGREPWADDDPESASQLGSLGNLAYVLIGGFFALFYAPAMVLAGCLGAWQGDAPIRIRGAGRGLAEGFGLAALGAAIGFAVPDTKAGLYAGPFVAVASVAVVVYKGSARWPAAPMVLGAAVFLVTFLGAVVHNEIHYATMHVPDEFFDGVGEATMDVVGRNDEFAYAWTGLFGSAVIFPALYLAQRRGSRPLVNAPAA